MLKFSIIVPVYKTEKYLPFCVDSILNQTYKDFELILIDDGSPDGCSQICDQYAKNDDRVKVIHKTNAGVSSARNRGIDEAVGKYIWFVDSDDYIEKNSLSILNRAIEKYDAEIYFFNTELTNDECINISFHDFFYYYYITYKVGFAPWNKIYKATYFREYNLLFDKEEHIGEDLLFNIIYYKYLFQSGNAKICFIPEKLYSYNNRIDSAMNSKCKYRIIQQLRLFEKISNELSTYLTDDERTYLFLLHLISGIRQSRNGSMSTNELTGIISNSKYKSHFKNASKILPLFFCNEHSSLLGRIRIRLFLYLANRNIYSFAGRIMYLI